MRVAFGPRGRERDGINLVSLDLTREKKFQSGRISCSLSFILSFQVSPFWKRDAIALSQIQRKGEEKADGKRKESHHE